MLSQPCDVVITGTPAKKSPYFNMVELTPDKRVRLCKRKKKGHTPRRQDAPAVFEMNASIYVFRTASLLRMKSLWDGELRLYEIPPERSCDIDREIDFKFVEVLMKEKTK
jgi:N-acylneuraminate cytidylyltransferase/CMP-N,N'-diacetyllegionaminic acid synthase